MIKADDLREMTADAISQQCKESIKKIENLMYQAANGGLTEIEINDVSKKITDLDKIKIYLRMKGYYFIHLEYEDTLKIAW